MCWPLLPTAPIDLEQETVASGSCDRPNLWMLQTIAPIPILRSKASLTAATASLSNVANNCTSDELRVDRQVCLNEKQRPEQKESSLSNINPVNTSVCL
ncbi:hypothetical protein UY3_16481 [Chelonia mydas]|uniref:Uncharacterized protein n=1 Tax=Chelonia mydas TaxID=8469 RepID=M7AU03_CHEMY|nr:hypothetical protein UY3_16481 [Chelonia mydas]